MAGAVITVRPYLAPIYPLSSPYRTPIEPLSNPYRTPIEPLSNPYRIPIEPLSNPYRTPIRPLSNLTHAQVCLYVGMGVLALLTVYEYMVYVHKVRFLSNPPPYLILSI